MYNLDGVDHINISFTGKTELGQYLSTMWECDILTRDGMFKSIEGYLYFLLTRDKKLRHLSGWAANSYGKKLVKLPKEFPEEIKQLVKEAIADKIIFGDMSKQIKDSILPFKFYYVFKDTEYMPPNLIWIPKFIHIVRLYLKGEINLEEGN